MWAAAIGAALTAVGGALAAWPLPRADGASIPPSAALLGPVDARRVYWVGHSLMDHRDPHARDGRNVIETVDAFATARGQRSASFAQTLWGSSLSLAYRGEAHGTGRREPALAAKRTELLEHGDRYDALVLIDTVPIAHAMKHEHSAYYATRFACDLLARRKDARIYLYEGWVNLQAASQAPHHGSPAAWRWGERLRDERRSYEALADAMRAGAVLEPGWSGRLLRFIRPAAPCAIDAPVLLVPVASAWAALDAALRTERWDFDQRPLQIADFFANPFIEWPADWPRDDVEEEHARAVLARLPRRHPAEPVDDIHPNARGVYLAALVHYAVLFRHSPVGLPALDSELPPETLRKLQELVWRLVRNDPRTGVRAAPE